MSLHIWWVSKDHASLQVLQALRAVNNASGPFDENLAPTPPGDEAACILGVCVWAYKWSILPNLRIIFQCLILIRNIF